MRYAGKVNTSAIEWGFHAAKPGVTLADVDKAIEWYIVHAGCRPAFKGYQPEGFKSPFPASACISVNDVVVHGVPNHYILKLGDLLTIDVGTECEGWFVDAARTRIVDGTNVLGARLIGATEDIMRAQLEVIKGGCDMLTLVQAAGRTARQHKVKILSEWGGHGISNKIHTEPFIPNALTEGKGHLFRSFEEQNLQKIKFVAGETYCIEPVCTFGSTETFTDEDGWTIRKCDGQLAAHTERCILVLENGIEVLS
jgi:methionyl aminopeptidase